MTSQSFSYLSPRAVLPCALVIFVLTKLAFGLVQPSVGQAQGAIITVNTTNDGLNTDGDCSLREAIQAANIDSAVDACLAGSGDDTIELPTGTYILSLSEAGEDNNATGDLDIKDNLTINGAGADRTIVDGKRLDRVLHVHSGFTIVINDMMITNGKTADGDLELGGPGVPGAGVYNAGTLALNNSIVSGNITGNGGNSSFGGAIGNGGDGGGIYNAGTLTLNNSTVSGNTTGDAGGCIVPGPCGSGGVGGGIYNAGTLTLNNSTVSDNTTGNGASPQFGFGSGGPGGGIANVGTLTLNNSTVSSNITGNGSPGGAGGGIANVGTLTLNNSTVSSNITGNGSPGGAGGGIANIGTLSLNNSIVISNTASGTGGGLSLFGDNATLINSVIIDNQAGDTGSGIYIPGGRLRLLHTTIARNSGGDGSGLYVTYSDSYSFTSVALTNTILVSQTVGVYVTSPNVAILNGVLWFRNGMNTGGAGTVTVTNQHIGNPAFAADDYHLTSASAAIDRGVSAGVGTDIDYEPRIQGAPDLGADELVTIIIRRAYLPIVCK